MSADDEQVERVARAIHGAQRLPLTQNIDPAQSYIWAHAAIAALDTPRTDTEARILYEHQRYYEGRGKTWPSWEDATPELRAQWRVEAADLNEWAAKNPTTETYTS